MKLRWEVPKSMQQVDFVKLCWVVTKCMHASSRPCEASMVSYKVHASKTIKNSQRSYVAVHATNVTLFEKNL